jgi:hypothetical protein
MCRAENPENGRYCWKCGEQLIGSSRGPSSPLSPTAAPVGGGQPPDTPTPKTEKSIENASAAPPANMAGSGIAGHDRDRITAATRHIPAPDEGLATHLEAADHGIPGDSQEVQIEGLDPMVSVTCPSGGERWTRGALHFITWSAEAKPGARLTGFKLELCRDGRTAKVLTAAAESRSLGWFIPEDLAPGSDYIIRVVAEVEGAPRQYPACSGAPFSIVPRLDEDPSGLDVPDSKVGLPGLQDSAETFSEGFRRGFKAGFKVFWAALFGGGILLFLLGLFIPDNVAGYIVLLLIAVCILGAVQEETKKSRNGLAVVLGFATGICLLPILPYLSHHYREIWAWFSGSH